MYVVKKSSFGKPMVMHVDKLIPFHGEISDQWKKHQDGTNDNTKAAADENNSSSAVAALVADPAIAS
jgi:hypothetical protein